MKITEFESSYKDFFPVGEGWKPLVLKLVKDIIAIDPEIEVSQVKEKFGGLRFYIWGGNNKVYALIEKAELKSYKICEACGATKNVYTKGSRGWISTLCDKCRRNR